MGRHSSLAPARRYFGNLNATSYHPALVAARAAVLAAACLSAAGAKEARTSIAVTASVAAMARIESESQPDVLDISAADLQRGFVEVLQATALTIRSNSAQGFALDVATLSPIVTSIIVRGFDGEQSLGSEGGTIVQRWQGARVVNLSLTFTLVLAPGMRAGRYPWPMRVAVRPLEAT